MPRASRMAPPLRARLEALNRSYGNGERMNDDGVTVAIQAPIPWKTAKVRRKLLARQPAGKIGW